MEVELPEGVKLLSHQCAGHQAGVKGAEAFLEGSDGTIIKPIQKPPKGLREVLFYQEIFDENCTDETLLSLRPLVPKFKGLWSGPHRPDVQYFRMEDITKPFNKPCILDIKVGYQTWDPDAAEDKIASEKSKFAFRESVKFLLLGMRIRNNITSDEIFYDNTYFRSFTPEEILTKGFNMYLQKDKGVYKTEIKNVLIYRLHKVRTWFLSQTKYKIYASSVLFVYDGDDNRYPTSPHSCPICHPSTLHVNLSTNENGDTKSSGYGTFAERNGLCNRNFKVLDEDSCPWMKVTDLRMIDLTHVHEILDGKNDENYLAGLFNIFKYLHQC